MAILRIYKIINDINEMIYVGSTYQTLANRFSAHKSKARSGSTTSIHTTMREIGIDNFRIELIKTIEMKTIQEYEQEEMNKFDPNLLINDKNAFDNETPKEYYDRNRDRINENKRNWRANSEEYRLKQKEYRELNKSKISEQRKKYVEENRDKINEYKRNWKANNEEYRLKQKMYVEENRDKINEYCRNWRAKKREQNETKELVESIVEEVLDKVFQLTLSK
jgi:hypothetical protein